MFKWILRGGVPPVLVWAKTNGSNIHKDVVAAMMITNTANFVAIVFIRIIINR
ncbi:MAG: hypothetical protein ABJB76_01900 [Candidatus Nitrosocosmicus sp.]